MTAPVHTGQPDENTALRAAAGAQAAEAERGESEAEGHKRDQ